MAEFKSVHSAVRPKALNWAVCAKFLKGQYMVLICIDLWHRYLRITLKYSLLYSVVDTNYSPSESPCNTQKTTPTFVTVALFTRTMTWHKTWELKAMTVISSDIVWEPEVFWNSRPSVLSCLTQLTQQNISPHPAPYQTVYRPSRQVWPNSPSTMSLPTQLPTKQSAVRPVKSGPTHPARYLSPPSSLPNSLQSVPSILTQLTQHDISPHTSPHQTHRTAIYYPIRTVRFLFRSIKLLICNSSIDMCSLHDHITYDDLNHITVYVLRTDRSLYFSQVQHPGRKHVAEQNHTFPQLFLSPSYWRRSIVHYTNLLVFVGAIV